MAHVIVSSGFLPPAVAPRPAAVQPHSIPLPYPAVEELPEFAGRIDSSRLQPAARHYNGSICRFGRNIFLAYRGETFDAVSFIGIARLSDEFAVVEDKRLEIPSEDATHFEDPRLCVIGRRLILQFAHVRFGVPTICRQRMYVIGHTAADDFASIRPMREIPLPFGNINGIEKNWSPFELPNGNTGIVYGQRPRSVLEVETRAGHSSCVSIRTPMNSTLSGRTPPLHLPGIGFLEFVGGHIKCPNRAARYWFGAQVFMDRPPYAVLRATKEPLAWGTEASPTIHSPRPWAGHPACIFPSGVMLEGKHVIVSCGVNDSYIALLRYEIASLLEKMEVFS